MRQWYRETSFIVIFLSSVGVGYLSAQVLKLLWRLF